MIKTLLRLEGAAIFLLSLFLYSKLGGNWLLFIVLLFTPDLSMIGYLHNNKTGAILYNLFHNFVVGIVLIFCGLLMNIQTLIYLGIIAVAHVSMDRALGYGLKLSTGFKNTHMGKIGK